MFTGASNFKIEGHSTFNAASTMNITYNTISHQDGNPTTVVPSGYVEGMTHCPTSTAFFTGRDDALQNLATFFSVNESRRSIFLLHGLGGAGKTQCALEFIRRFKGRFTQIYFISAHSEELIKASFYDIAVLNNPNAPQSWESGHRWLASHEEDWLILLDNADDPKINFGQFLPPCDHGNIIITSRNQGLVNIAIEACEINSLHPGEASQLLLKHAVKREITVQEASTAALISEELHYFALALVQAGAYIKQHNCLGSYISRLKKQKAQLLGKNMLQNLDNYRLSIYSTWNLSWNELDEPSRIFLNLCSYLHNEGIPRELFQKAVENIKSISEPLGTSNALALATSVLEIFTVDQQWDDIQMDDIILNITSYSLLNVVQDGVYSLHPLVHEWIKDSMHQKVKDDIQIAIQGIIAASVSAATEGDIIFLRALAPNIIKVEYLEINEIAVQRAIGNFWYRIGHGEKTLRWWEPVLKKMKESLGTQHPDVLSHTDDLANVYLNLGKYNDAFQLVDPLVITAATIFGKEDPKTLKFETDLALSLLGLGKYNEALQLQQAVLETSQRILGILELRS
ncbi:hypothetical protein BT96DRAFT_1020591 [Gymnopus androsaceus JB14]|uniref:NB-ARC domain-containing protein n=1 Tax=Gymnopus androsaceus JB14 TaxID=1447944 RepID=A0A6A4HL54_9AGAR|nr:hypothetical protein BT96DRAFT_1020591 [Gymnopus androsaceus JB14]